MGLKDAIDKTVNNVKDTVHEATHRSTADAEKVKRDVAGDEMTPGEKVGSVFNQGKNEVQADIDRAKRDVRNTP